MRNIALLLALSVAHAMAIQGQTRTIDFERETVGQTPSGFLFGHTANVGAPGRWLVQAEGVGKVLAQLDPDRARRRFPVAVLSDVTATDIAVRFRFKPVSGPVDQPGGLVWRF